MQASPKEHLQQLLIGLCSTDEDEVILERMCAEVIEVSDTKATFKDESFEYERAKGLKISNKFPQSFRDIASLFNKLSWYDGGAGFIINDKGHTSGYATRFFKEAEDYYDNFDTQWFDDPDYETTTSFEITQNGLYFDPKHTLDNGEPAMAYMDHGVLKWVQVESVNHLNYKQILLRMLSDCMIETKYIKEIFY